MLTPLKSPSPSSQVFSPSMNISSIDGRGGDCLFHQYFNGGGCASSSRSVVGGASSIRSNKGFNSRFNFHGRDSSSYRYDIKLNLR